jgi:hypothetical protein
LRLPALFLLGWIAALYPAAHAAPPPLEFLYPAGGRVGTTVSVTAGGKHESWPPQIWSSDPALEVSAAEEKGTLRIEIPADMPAGPCHIRLYNDDGASALRCFMVGRITETLDQEPNDALEQAQALTEWPITVNGRLNKEGDTDSFQVSLEPGQWLVATVDAYSLDSPVDPLLQLLDAAGTQVAFNHDRHELDPALMFQSPQAATYTLQLSAFAFPPKADIRLTGGDDCVYRLILHKGPVGNYLFPQAIQRGHREALHLHGWNLGTPSGVTHVEVDATTASAAQDHLTVTVPGGGTELSLRLSDWPEVRELEPNNASTESQPVLFPAAINGRIGDPHDRDNFRFSATKGEVLHFQVESQILGFPLDAVLTLFNDADKQIAESDDIGKRPDPELQWTSPADGTFRIEIRDLLDRGGTDFVYRLAGTHPVPGFEAEALADAVVVKPGESTELKVKVTRSNGFEGSLAVLLDGLPEGVSATSASVPVKGADLTLSILASRECKPANLPIRALVVSTDPAQPAAQFVAATLKGKNSAAGHLTLNQSQHIWLTVPPKPPEPEEKPAETPPATP